MDSIAALQNDLGCCVALSGMTGVVLTNNVFSSQ